MKQRNHTLLKVGDVVSVLYYANGWETNISNLLNPDEMPCVLKKFDVCLIIEASSSLEEQAREGVKVLTCSEMKICWVNAQVLQKMIDFAV